MRLFDVVDMAEGVGSALASRLGFSMVYAMGRDIYVTQQPMQQGKNQIVCSKDTILLMKAIRNQDVIGISFEDNEIIAKVLAAAREAEKPIVINISCIFAPSASERYRNIGRIRGLVRAAMMARCNITFISGAKSADYLLSTNQLMEIAMFLGMPEDKAKRALAIMGDYVDS